VDADVNMPLALIGDPLRLQQIITNLVGNAIKFTNKGGSVVISVKEINTTSRDNRTNIQFYVKDTGVGMKEEYLKRLFEPFTQADASTTRKYGGTGLGLTISKQLIEKMNGRIWVESELGKGTSFFFTVCLDRQPEEQDRELVLSSDIEGLQILVVDDNEDSRLILQKMLVFLRFKPEICESGQAAINFLKNREKAANIQLILMDWLMPTMDGVEACRIIRNELDLKIPIIMMVSFGCEAEIQSARAGGIDAFLTKPFNALTFLDKVMDMFGKKSSTISDKKKQLTTDVSVYKKRLIGCHVLVAEDNITNQQIALAILEGAKLQVQIANNGVEAVQAIKNQSFDAVLMDMQMPEMDGYDATRTIRKDSKFKDIPIIAMTAHAMKGDEEKCLAAGMDGYVTKPINQEILFKTLSKMIKTKVISEDEKKFLELNNKIVTDIWDAFKQQNWFLLESLSNSLKDSANKINAKKVTNISRMVEKICKDKKTIHKSFLTKLEIEIQEIFDRLL